jgi:hypothetical protein
MEGDRKSFWSVGLRNGHREDDGCCGPSIWYKYLSAPTVRGQVTLPSFKG